MTWRLLKQYSLDEMIDDGQEHKRSSRDKPSQDDVKHARVRILIEFSWLGIQGEQSDQSDQQDQLLFNSIRQVKQTRFWVLSPIHWSFKQRRERVWLEPFTLQDELHSIWKRNLSDFNQREKIYPSNLTMQTIDQVNLNQIEWIFEFKSWWNLPVS